MKCCRVENSCLCLYSYMKLVGYSLHSFKMLYLNQYRLSYLDQWLSLNEPLLWIKNTLPAIFQYTNTVFIEYWIYNQVGKYSCFLKRPVQYIAMENICILIKSLFEAFNSILRCNKQDIITSSYSYHRSIIEMKWK